MESRDIRALESTGPVGDWRESWKRPVSESCRPWATVFTKQEGPSDLQLLLCPSVRNLNLLVCTGDGKTRCFERETSWSSIAEPTELHLFIHSSNEYLLGACHVAALVKALGLQQWLRTQLPHSLVLLGLKFPVPLASYYRTLSTFSCDFDLLFICPSLTFFMLKFLLS